MASTLATPANVSHLDRKVALDFAADHHGFVVRCPHGQKSPHKGWEPRANTEARCAQLIEDLRGSDDNVGLHLCGRLVDVDVDGDDATRFLIPALDAILPPCNHTWGRKSKPRSHRVYQLKETAEFNPADYPILRLMQRIPTVKVEVRGGPPSRGEYSLLPGSVHPSGEFYEWADRNRAKSAPTPLPLAALLKGVRLAGAVAVIAPHWGEGLRQELTLALAGFMHRAVSLTEAIDEHLFTITERDATNLLRVIMAVAEDDPKDIRARIAAFEATWAKAATGAPITGATRLAELCGDPDLPRQLYTLLTDNPNLTELDDFVQRFAIWQGPALVVDLAQAAAGQSKPLMSRPQFASSYAHCFLTVGDKRKLLPELLWSMPNALRVRGLTFAPGEPTLVSEGETTKVNQWAGFAVAPLATTTAAAVRRFTDYVRRLLASDDEVLGDWIMAWLADIFQRPARKCGTALVLVGRPGVGKSWLGHRILGPLIGPAHYAATNSVENITKTFNVAFAHRLLIQCDEAINARQRNIASRLKAIITDPYQMIEPKGVDSYFLPLHARLLLTSNEMENALHLSDGADDRRYTIVEVSDAERGRVAEYWGPFADWLAEPDTLPAIHRFLLDYEFDPRLVRSPLATDAKELMQQAHWDVLDAWLAGVLARNHPLDVAHHQHWFDACDEGETGPIIRRLHWPEFIHMAAWVQDYNDFVRRHLRAPGADRVMDEARLGRWLADRGLRPDDRPKRRRVLVDDPRTGQRTEMRVRLYRLPDKQAIRAYLERRYGMAVPILNDDDEADDEPPQPGESDEY